MKRIVSIFSVVAIFAGVFTASAFAGVTRSGNTFTASPSYCSCWTTIDGYEFKGIPYSPFIRDVFLRLPASTPVVVDGTDTGIWDLLRKDPKYLSLPPVTSGSVEVVVSGEVLEETNVDDPEDVNPF
jgi:hypothetical protein